jgi:hypothetical protein
MATWVWIVIAIVVVIAVVVAVAAAARGRRTKNLREGFGPEYDRAVEHEGDRRAGERELLERQKRHDALDIRARCPQRLASGTPSAGRSRKRDSSTTRPAR